MRMPARRRPRYAEVTTALAVVVALGGTSYAVTAVPRDSVGTAQLKAHAVTKSKLATGSLDGRPLRALSALQGRQALREPRAPRCPESPGTRSWWARRRPTSNPRWPFARPESGRSEAAERCLTASFALFRSVPYGIDSAGWAARGAPGRTGLRNLRDGLLGERQDDEAPTTTLRRRRRDACAHRRARRHELCRDSASLATAWAPRNSRPTPSRRPSSQPASPSRVRAAREARQGRGPGRRRGAARDTRRVGVRDRHRRFRHDRDGEGALPGRQARARRWWIHVRRHRTPLPELPAARAAPAGRLTARTS